MANDTLYFGRWNRELEIFGFQCPAMRYFETLDKKAISKGGFLMRHFFEDLKFFVESVDEIVLLFRYPSRLN